MHVLTNLTHLLHQPICHLSTYLSEHRLSIARAGPLANKVWVMVGKAIHCFVMQGDVNHSTCQGYSRALMFSTLHEACTKLVPVMLGNLVMTKVACTSSILVMIYLYRLVCDVLSCGTESIALQHQSVSVAYMLKCGCCAVLYSS